MNYLCMLVPSILFGVGITFAAKRLLAALCPSFYDRVNWSLGCGVYSAGLYEYSTDFAATDDENAILAAAWTKPLLTLSAMSAYVLMLIGTGSASIFACFFWAFIGSLLPTIFLLLLLVVGFLLIFLAEEFGLKIQDSHPDFSPGYTSLYSLDETQEHINRARLVRLNLLSMDEFTARLPVRR